MTVCEIVARHNVAIRYNYWHDVCTRLVKTVRTNIFAKNACCLKLQLLILFFVKLIISDMPHRITYMYINFQQNQVCRSVKTVHTNIFAQYISQVV